jgi:hypothetical protein
MTDAYVEALERLQGSGPEFDSFLANHGPMAAEALVTMNQTAGLQSWVDDYRGRLADAPTDRRELDPREWREHLGEVRLVGDWTRLMRGELADDPWQTVLLRWWQRLLPGLAASATHGLIRTAHAVRALERELDPPEPLVVDELAQGLALWAARYQTLPGRPGLSGPLDAVEAIRALERMPRDAKGDGPGVGGRLRALDGLSSFPRALERWGGPADVDQALDELIGAAARVVAARDDAPIALCHTVTAPAAIRLVIPLLPADLARASVAGAWQAVGGLVAAYGDPRLDAESAVPQVSELPPVDVVAARAAEHGDEHVIKLTEAALREYRRGGDATFLVAADRFHDRVSRPAR